MPFVFNRIDSSEARQKIMRSLADGKKKFTELKKETGYSDEGLSKTLKHLKSSELVIQERKGGPYSLNEMLLLSWKGKG
ncbi:MAG: helix-turn-helix domain-containing protein, partial [Candidatus Bathyarchaeia archaeon]